MDIQKEIIDAINVLIDKKISQVTGGKDIATVVTAVNGNSCTVSINGASYTVHNGIGVTLAVGTPVWVRNPGNMAQAFIEATR